MKLLDRNQYAIWFSDRCNYTCSYCTNHASPEAPRSPLEANTRALIELFDRVRPGVVMLSGGEPFLWKDFPLLLEALPQHYWVFLTNLSFLPKWVDHPNIKLFIPAYHEEFADEARFEAHLRELHARGRRLHVKLIVKPGREWDQIARFERWNDMGVLTSLVPLEYTARFDRRFLADVIARYRTSSLYNSRFFRLDSPPDVDCVAGTEESFQVNPDGRLVRCSSVFDGAGEDGAGSIWKPAFDRRPRRCPASGSCYCEWHHWGQMAPANDNLTWTRFIESGEWQRPSLNELLQFILDMRWDPAGRNDGNSRESLFRPLRLRGDDGLVLSDRPSASG
jgi:MoaA/NifB/PqqE/SkfB family radical SAM enzyme